MFKGCYVYINGNGFVGSSDYETSSQAEGDVRAKAKISTDCKEVLMSGIGSCIFEMLISFWMMRSPIKLEMTCNGTEYCCKWGNYGFPVFCIVIDK